MKTKAISKMSERCWMLQPEICSCQITNLSSRRSDRRAEYAMAASWVFPSFTNNRNGTESSFKHVGDTDGTSAAMGSDRSRFAACFNASFFRLRFSTKRLLIISANSSKLSVRVWIIVNCFFVKKLSVGCSCCDIDKRKSRAPAIHGGFYQQSHDVPVS